MKWCLASAWSNLWPHFGFIRTIIDLRNGTYSVVTWSLIYAAVYFFFQLLPNTTTAVYGKRAIVSLYFDNYTLYSKGFNEVIELCMITSMLLWLPGALHRKLSLGVGRLYTTFGYKLWLTFVVLRSVRCFGRVDHYCFQTSAVLADTIDHPLNSDADSI